MKITSKNGVKLNIHPKNPWNILDWISVLNAANKIRSAYIYINTKEWKMSYGSLAEDNNVKN